MGESFGAGADEAQDVGVGPGQGGRGDGADGGGAEGSQRGGVGDGQQPTRPAVKQQDGAHMGVDAPRATVLSGHDGFDARPGGVGEGGRHHGQRPVVQRQHLPERHPVMSGGQAAQNVRHGRHQFRAAQDVQQGLLVQHQRLGHGDRPFFPGYATGIVPF